MGTGKVNENIRLCMRTMFATRTTKTYTGVRIIFLLFFCVSAFTNRMRIFSVNRGKMMEVGGALEEAGASLTALTFERKVFFVIFLDVVIHRILLFSYLWAMRTYKVSVSITNVFGSSHGHD
jgi:hypothetical protein